MNFIEIKNSHDRLLGVTHLEADLMLLRMHNPQHKILSAVRFNAERDSSDVLMALLSLVTEEEIVLNRRQIVARKDLNAEVATKQTADDEAARLAQEEANAKQAADDEAARLAQEEANAKQTADVETASQKKSSQKMKSTPK